MPFADGSKGSGLMALRLRGSVGDFSGYMPRDAGKKDHACPVCGTACLCERAIVDAAFLSTTATGESSNE